jgi:hypothetical protein
MNQSDEPHGTAALPVVDLRRTDIGRRLAPGVGGLGNEVVAPALSSRSAPSPRRYGPNSADQESALQPQAHTDGGGEGGKVHGGIAQQLEAALLDVAPDTALDMARKRKAYHWDARKGKYIKTTLGELGNAASGLKGVAKALNSEGGGSVLKAFRQGKSKKGKEQGVGDA